MSEDFGLTSTLAGYELVAPTDDTLARMRSRFVTQFLSLRDSGRGSTFMSELVAGRLKTNSDILSVFALTAAEIIAHMRLLAEDIFPYRAILNTFTIVSSFHISLNYTIFSDLGNIADNIVATAEG